MDVAPAFQKLQLHFSHLLHMEKTTHVQVLSLPWIWWVSLSESSRLSFSICKCGGWRLDGMSSGVLPVLANRSPQFNNEVMVANLYWTLVRKGKREIKS